MEKELLNFISEHSLSPFSRLKTSIKSDESIFKTRDAKSIFNKTLGKISESFCFSETSNLWHCFPFTGLIGDIKRRQDFFRNIKPAENSFLKELKSPKNCWKPKYSIIAVTEDEKTFLELQKLNCPVQFINSEIDVQGLEEYDIVQVVDCEQFSPFLEQLPQSVFLNSSDEVYLERFLEILSGWKENLEILSIKAGGEINNISAELMPFLEFLKDKPSEHISREKIDSSLEAVNEEIEQEIGKMNVSGTSLLSILSKGKLPENFKKIIENAVSNCGIPEHLFVQCIPVSVDEQEFEKFIRQQNAEEHTSAAEKIKKHAEKIRKIPEILKLLSDKLLLFDFESGVSKFIQNSSFPEYSEEFILAEAKNLFLETAQPISFNLDPKNQCSILTGANSGGKTTLLEHIIQSITLFQIGLPVQGRIKMPIFTDVYYFAKNKGSASKGAFETLLVQMAGISPGKKTLILADEIESVTEPGVAGKIIAATAEYFIQKECFMVIATHLGQEIQKNMPTSSRIDGIEAKGLDEYFELIVDHNPVMGKLASSTPELIVEKLANSKKTDYFSFLNQKIKSKT